MGWMKNIFVKIGSFFEMIKFEHSLFALPFAYMGLFLAEKGWPRLSVFLGVTVAMVSFRTMAMGLNRILDIRIDALNPRTRNRALVTGEIQRSLAWRISILSLLVFECSAYLLGPLCFGLSPVPVVLALIYPFSKRFTWFSHFILGLILGIAPYGAWLASCGEFSWIPALLSFGVMTWVAGFDMFYALQDMDFDREHGLYSVPAKFGMPATLVLTRFLHIVSVLVWVWAGGLAGLGAIFNVGIVLVVLFLVYEHFLVWRYGLAKINEAFFVMNGLASIVLFLTVLVEGVI